ncbi:unnamed protein product [Prunus armeniaca]
MRQKVWYPPFCSALCFFFFFALSRELDRGAILGVQSASSDLRLPIPATVSLTGDLGYFRPSFRFVCA